LNFVKSHRVTDVFLLLTIIPIIYSHFAGFPGGSDSKESACNVGDTSLIPGSGRFPGEGNGDLPREMYSCLENSTDRGAWHATVQIIRYD